MKAKLFRGLAAIMAILAAATVGLTEIAVEYRGSVNLALGVDTNSSTGMNGQDYYVSDFGEFTQENQDKLVAAENLYIQNQLEEGAVLLKNNGALPLESNERLVTLFGNAVANPVYTGKAGGPSVDVNRAVPVNKAFINAGFQINQTLFDAYKNSGVSRKLSATEPVIGEVSKEFYTEELKAAFSEYNDAAIVLLARSAGEGMDMLPSDSEGISQLALHKNERDLLQMINDSGVFKKIIVLINSSYAMEVNWLDEYNVDACLVIGDLGLTGMTGVVNILTGQVNPSGHLVDTYAANSLSAPAVQNFGDFSIDGSGEKYVVEAEGIYVGYKYYETRYEDCILGQGNADGSAGVWASKENSWNYSDEMSYPFGYGLSYSTFEQTIRNFQYNENSDSFELTVTVKNTGSIAGKSVVEVYVQSPYTDYDRKNLVEKSAIQIVGFEKTDELQPGEEQDVNVYVDRYLCSSYDCKGVKGYILDAGIYYFAIGDDAHDALNNILAAKGAEGMTDINGNSVTGDASKVRAYELAEMDSTSYANTQTGASVTNVLTGEYSADVNDFYDDPVVTYLSRQDWEGTYPTPVKLHASNLIEEAKNGTFYVKSPDAPSVQDVLSGTETDYTLLDMHGLGYNDPQWDDYLQQMTLEDLSLVTVDGNGNPAIEAISKPKSVAVDGPRGVGSSYRYHGTCSVYASEVITASSWSHEIISKLGYYEAEDALWSKVQMLWAPGANLHRTVFSGRNFEYYSEDSIFAAICLNDQTSQYAGKGVICGPKHFVGNDQETNRNGMFTFMTEQRLRQECLKVFEFGVRNGYVSHLMTCYNCLGVKGSNVCVPVMTTILQQEWGFTGLIITDAGSAAFDSATNPMIEALISGIGQLCFTDEHKAIADYITNTDDGYLAQILLRANKNFYYLLANSNLINGMSQETAVSESTPWWEVTLYALTGVFSCTFVCSVVLCAVLTCRRKRGVTEC